MKAVLCLLPAFWCVSGSGGTGAKWSHGKLSAVHGWECTLAVAAALLQLAADLANAFAGGDRVGAG